MVVGQSMNLNTDSGPLSSSSRACCCMQALEYQMQQGVADAARQDLYLMPLAAQHEYDPELHSNVCVLKLLQPV